MLGSQHFDLSTRHSFCTRMDPRWKLAALVSAAIAAALLRNLVPAVVALLAALVLTGLSRLPVAWYLSRLGMLLLFLGLFAVPMPFLSRDDGPAWLLGTVRVSQHGLIMALLLISKAVAIFTLMFILFATAPLDATLKAAHSLRVPGLIVQLIVLTLRYVWVLSNELTLIRVALRVRGYRNRLTRHSYRTIGHVAGTLLVRGSERAERVGQAMRCRGFDGRFRSLTEFRTSPIDVLTFILIAGGATGLVLWDRLCSF